jgi:hypothetical protein
MLNIKLLKSHNIIICPDEKKKEILKITNNLDNDIKFLTKEDIKKNFIFSYDEKTIVYLMKKKNLTYEGAKELINNCYYAKKGFDSKLDNLVDIREELKANNLIEEDKFFNLIFNNKEIFVYGYSCKDKELNKLLKMLNINVTYLDEEDSINHNYYEFNEIDEEVDYFFNEVLRLVDEGVDISSIKLLDYNKEEYETLLWKTANLYNVKIGFKNQDNLTLSPFFKRFLALYDELDLQEAFNKLNEEVSIDNYRFMDGLKRVLVSAYGLFEDKEEERKFIIDRAKETKLGSIKYDKQIDIVSDTYSPDDHIFILGFNNGTYPKVKKDIDYLNDKEKEYLEINTTNDENVLFTERLINFLNTHHNLHISLKKNIGKNVFYDSTLISKLGMNKLKYIPSNTRYSYKASAIEVCKSKDIYEHYGILNNNYNAMDIGYKEFDHSFKNTELVKNDEELKVSYSSIELYNECPFAYYVSNILKADAFEGNFFTSLGQVFHALLEESVKNKTIPTEEDLLHIKLGRGKEKKSFDEIFVEPSEKFFALHLFPKILEVIEKNNSLLQNSTVNDAVVEENFEYQLDDKTLIKGFIDKILLDTKNKYMTIIDYKSGKFNFDYRKVEHGINMQLPIYAFLSTHQDKYKDYKVQGIYIQNILTNDENEDKNFLLTGVTLNDMNLVNKFVGLDNVKTYISNLRIDKDQNLAATVSNKLNRLMDENQFNDLVDLTLTKVKETVKNIRNGEYRIKPKRFNGNETKCTNCPFGDLCFKSPNDYEEIKIEKEKKEGEESGD